MGDDAWGRALTQLLVDLGVGIRGLQRYAAAPTRSVYVLLDESGERSFAGFSRPVPEDFADAHLQVSALNASFFDQTQYLVMGTLGLAYDQTREALRYCVQKVVQQRGRVLVDINWRPMFWSQPAIATAMIHELLTQVSYLKLSIEEADWLFETRDPVAIATRVPNLEGVLVTAGAAGCDYWLAGHQGRVPGFVVDVEDTTGAGDAFVAGFIHQLCQQGHACLQDAECARDVVTYASAVGALTTTRPGAIAAQPSAREVDAFLFLRR